jgi:hypothetical protein
MKPVDDMLRLQDQVTNATVDKFHDDIVSERFRVAVAPLDPSFGELTLRSYNLHDLPSLLLIALSCSLSLRCQRHVVSCGVGCAS